MMTYTQLTKTLGENEVQATIKTNHGDVTVKLFKDIAPKTVENFTTHAKNGYYDGQIFHRVIKDFMIQGGDPTGTGMGGESIWGGNFEDEFSTEAFNLYGALSMANAGPGTNGSQFFIVQLKEVPEQMVSQLEGAGYPAEIIEAYKAQGGTPWLDQRHTVFGHVIEGFDIVENIADVKTGAQDRPEEEVKIQTIEVAE
ncbi:peptidylprolyl isomerase [Salinicoccus sp. YB14-2]|uniref:peptidylprolyl isomerase n=1 Tax=Salinicoccus sp. YB14-2 TaxID=1572701 RepID=UPI0018D10F9F|nr:peptidylprolyl isomerase [Salinicoccus sp. YB14-2]